MDSPIWFYTINLGWFIVYVKGSQVIISKLRCILVSEGFFSPCQTVQTLMKCLMVWHFIWIFTVCHSTCSGVSSVQRVDKGCHETIIIPPANFVCRGYTVFTLSVRPCVRPSVTLCFLNNSKSHCWIFIKPSNMFI